jgi:hypothetical protein
MTTKIQICLRMKITESSFRLFPKTVNIHIIRGQLKQWCNFYNSNDLNKAYDLCLMRVKSTILKNKNIVGLVAYS